MAVTQGKSPVIMTAAADSIGNDGRHWAVTGIQYVTGSTGADLVLLDKVGGQEVVRIANPGNNANYEIQLQGEWYDGFYVSAIGTGAKVYIYYR